MAHQVLATSNATSAAIFRSLDAEHPPTLVFDETDAMFGTTRAAEQHEDLRSLLNAGFQRGKPAVRCVGPQQVPTPFPTFAMAALAGIGRLPDTITDRAVNITMRRRKPGEVVRPFRERRDRPALDGAREMLAAWLGDEEVRAALGDAEPEMDLEDRAADTWEGLIAVADLAGGTWPVRAREAARVLIAEADAGEADDSRGVRLLHDMADLFDTKFSDWHGTTDVVVPFLRDIEDGPWREMDLTPHLLGKVLREFGIASRRNTTGSKRGYHRADFVDAWERYPRPSDHSGADHPSEASESVNTGADQAKRSDASSDALSDASKASEQASERLRRPDPLLTLPDASDASPAHGRTKSPDAQGSGPPEF